MIKFLALFVIVVFTGEVISTSPACKLVILEYTPKILKLQTDIDKAIVNNTRQITSTEYIINQITNQAQSSVDDQLKSLNNLIKESKWKAWKQRKNIARCLIRESIAIRLVNTKGLNKCRLGIQSDILRKKSLVQLKAEKTALKTSSKVCLITNPIFPSPLRRCLDKSLEGTKKRVEDVQSSLQDSLNKLNNNSINCIGNTLGQLDLDVEDVRVNFKNCVDKILS